MTPIADQQPKEQMLELHELEHDTATQSRETIDSETVERYGEAMREGVKFDPIVVFYDGVRYWIVDGWHRVGAAQWASKKSINCLIYKGTKADAEWQCTAANKKSQLHRSNEDKRKSVLMALRLKPEMADNAIAHHVGVNDKTVAKYRAELRNFRSSDDGPSLAEQYEKRVGRDGKLRPATQPAREPQSTSPPTEVDPEDLDDDPMVELMAEDYRRWLAGLSKIASEVKAESEDPEKGYYLRLQVTRFTTGTQALRALLHCCMPAAVCPKCDGDGCPKCGSTGFITQEMVDSEEK